MTLLAASKAALAELIHQHAIHGECETPEHCPSAIAIRDLRLAIEQEERERPDDPS